MVYIRLLNRNDIDRIYEIKKNPSNFDPIYNEVDYTNLKLEDVQQWFYNFINEIDTTRFGICLQSNNLLIGAITLCKMDYIDKKCYFHIYIDSNHWGKGYAKLALTKIINYCKNILDFDKLFLDVHKDNIRAIKLYEKLKFEKEKIEGNFIVMKLIL